jgi:hypothetical protein
LEETADTSQRELASEGLGDVETVQFKPFQCSARVRLAPQLLLLKNPTVHASVGDTTATPLS